MERIVGCVPLTVLVLSVLSCGNPSAENQAQRDPVSSKMTVTTTAGLVSLDAQNVPLGILLTELGQRTQLAMTLPEEMKAERMTVLLQQRPLEAALREILLGKSYTFLYRQEKGQEVIVGVRLFPQHRPMTRLNASQRQTGISLATRGVPPTLVVTGSWGRAETTGGDPKPVRISDDMPLDDLKRSLTESKDPAFRSAALDAIANRGTDRPVNPFLAQSLSDGDYEVRGTALSLLMSSFDAVPIGPLASMATQDANPEFRMDAMSLMTDQLFKDERPEQDWAAVTAALNRGLSDPDPDVREQAEMLLPTLDPAAQPTSSWGKRR